MNVKPAGGLEAVEHVVAIGASAGGLEALEALFDHLAPNTGAAFVVITHLSPDFKSIMDELLARRTAMPVRVVEDGEPLEANHVYVIPPGKDMIVQAGRLYLTDREGHGAPSAPIDLFFGSLARAYGRRATGVILSGTGADGSRGARALREAGGYVLAQALETARFEGMPRAAQETGSVDVMLPPEAIGPALAGRLARLDETVDSPPPIEAGDAGVVTRILERVLGGANVDFSEYKKSTILRRIGRRMQIVGLDSFAAYLEALDQSPAEVRLLAEDLLIVVTEFFRDPAAFQLLADKVMPEMLAGSAEDRPIRIWAPAVGTGQEAYSLAMLLREAAAAAGREPRVQIFATDISPAALERAAAGIYSEAEMANVSQERRAAFFARGEDGLWQARPEIRNWIVFATHNMLRDPPFINTNLISCRNALIYLEGPAQNKALSLFHFSLAPGGFLLLGPSESVGEDVGRFVAVDPRWRLFRKRGADRRDLAAMGELIGAGRWSSDLTRRRPAGPGPSRGPNATALQAALELFAPAALMIDRDRELLHVVGAGQSYLAPPASGPFSRDVLKLVRPGLRAPLSAAIERALRSGEAAAYTGGDGAETVALTAHPLPAPDGASIERVLIVFGPAPVAATPLDPTPFDKLAEQRIAYLEDALRAERDNLQTMLEQLETSNEELQSTNEELMTANEELQSTNEELHSVNEELYTVNAEYERKNEELTQLTKDVSSLLQATGVGVVFVDRQLRVRRFTPTATRVVNLIPGDEGRDLRHLTHRLAGFDLCAWLERAMTRDEMLEVERRADDGAVWTVRAAPVGEGGAVVSLIEVTRLVQAEAEARARSAELRQLLDWVGAVSLRFGADGRLLGGSGAWRAFTGQDPAAEPGADAEGWLAILHPDDAEKVAAAWRAARDAARAFEVAARLRRPEGDWRPVRLAGGPGPAPDGGEGWFVYARADG